MTLNSGFAIRTFFWLHAETEGRELLLRFPHAQSTFRRVPINFRRTQRASPALPQFVGELCNLIVPVCLRHLFLLVACPARPASVAKTRSNGGCASRLTSSPVERR